MTWDGLNEDQRDHTRGLARIVEGRRCPACSAVPGVGCTSGNRTVWPHHARSAAPVETPAAEFEEPQPEAPLPVFHPGPGWTAGPAPEGVRSERMKYRTEDGEWQPYHRTEEAARALSPLTPDRLRVGSLLHVVGTFSAGTLRVTAIRGAEVFATSDNPAVGTAFEDIPLRLDGRVTLLRY